MEQKYKLQQVLSPRKFLPKELRQLPRSDARKTTLKNDISECLVSSKNYNEFEALMKAKNYQVIKGRGIAFIDSKGVYAKGSEVGYSLATIEKILSLSGEQKRFISKKPESHGLLQKSGSHFRQTEAKSLSPELSHDLKLERSKILTDLLRPVHTDSKIPFELIKKKKQKRSQHL